MRDGVLPLKKSRDCCVYIFERENGDWGDFSNQEKPNSGVILRKLPRLVRDSQAIVAHPKNPCILWSTGRYVPHSRTWRRSDEVHTREMVVGHPEVLSLDGQPALLLLRSFS